jgi:hypothetical protein
VKMFSAAGAAATTLTLSSPGPNAFAQVAAPTLDSEKSATYKVESYPKQVGFSISRFGFTNFSGPFAGAIRTLQLDPAQLASLNLEISLPMLAPRCTITSSSMMMCCCECFPAAVSGRQPPHYRWSTPFIVITHFALLPARRTGRC